jgi:hypothetical protein
LLYQEISGPYQRQDIINFTNNYDLLRTETPELILDRCTEEALRDIVDFYHSVARPWFLNFLPSYVRLWAPVLKLTTPHRWNKSAFYGLFTAFNSTVTSLARAIGGIIAL